MRSLTNVISAKARLLAFRDGYYHKMVNDGPAYQVLVLPEDDLEISISEETGVLELCRLARTSVLMQVGSNGALIRTSPDEVLESVLEILQKRTVLDDLAGI